jgi:hypothetical protein
VAAADDGAGRPPPYGRFALELGGSHSSTRIGGADPIHIERAFATPALRLDVTVPEALGGFDLKASTRLAYRYSEADKIQPVGSTRVYALSFQRAFAAAPVHLEIGRFRSRFEPFGGYTDGVAIRFGDRPFGAGFVLGLQPDRWNEAFSVDRPKATVFVDGERRGADWSWLGDLSAHFVSSGHAQPEERFIGASQRLILREIRINQDLQISQDPDRGSLSLSFLRVQGTVGLSTSVQVLAGYTLRRKPEESQLGVMLRPESERLLVGLRHRRDRVGLGTDFSRSFGPAGGRASTGYHAHLDVEDALPFVASMRIAASYWEGSEGDAFSIGPTLSGSRGDARISVGYRLYRADFLSRETTQHGADLSADFPLAGGLRASLQLRGDLSDTLRSEHVRLQVYRRF